MGKEMRKVITLFGSLLVLGSTLNAENTAIIKNGGFENKLSSWSRTWLVGKLDNRAHCGNYCLKMGKDNGKVFSCVFALACGPYIAVSIWQLVGLGVTKVFKHGQKTTK